MIPTSALPIHHVEPSIPADNRAQGYAYNTARGRAQLRPKRTRGNVIEYSVPEFGLVEST